MSSFWRVFVTISFWVLVLLLCAVFLHNCSRPQFYSVSMVDNDLATEIMEQKGAVDWSQLQTDSLGVVHIADSIDSASFEALKNRILREEKKAGRLMTTNEMSERITGYYDKLIDVLIALFILFSFASYFVIDNRFRKKYEEEKNAFADSIKQLLMEILPFDRDLINGIATTVQSNLVTKDDVKDLEMKIKKSNEGFALLAKVYDELTEEVDSKREVDVDEPQPGNEGGK